MAEELTKEEKQRLKEERRKAFEAAHPELAAKRKEAEQKKKKVQKKITEAADTIGELSLNDQEEARRQKMEDLRKQALIHSDMRMKEPTCLPKFSPGGAA